MFHFASKGGYYLSAAFIQERPLIEHIRYMHLVLITGHMVVKMRNTKLAHIIPTLLLTHYTCSTCNKEYVTAYTTRRKTPFQ